MNIFIKLKKSIKKSRQSLFNHETIKQSMGYDG